MSAARTSNSHFRTFRTSTGKTANFGDAATALAPRYHWRGSRAATDTPRWGQHRRRTRAPDRVCYIHLSYLTSSLLERLATLMQEPFPVLWSHYLRCGRQTPPVLPDTLLGGSAPRYCHSACLAFHFRHYQDFFCLRSTLSVSRFKVCHILGTFRPKR